MSKSKSKETELELHERIRKEFKSGKRKIEINGTMFSIKRLDRNPKYTIRGETVTQKESWLCLSPVGDKILPTMQIELKDKGNLRSKV